MIVPVSLMRVYNEKHSRHNRSPIILDRESNYMYYIYLHRIASIPIDHPQGRVNTRPLEKRICIYITFLFFDIMTVLFNIRRFLLFVAVAMGING